MGELGEDFDSGDDQISDVLPIIVANKPYIRSFQKKVLNSIFYTNDTLYEGLSFNFQPWSYFKDKCKSFSQVAIYSFPTQHSKLYNINVISSATVQMITEIVLLNAILDAV